MSFSARLKVVTLRIDNKRQSVVCGILLSSVAIVCTLIYYI